VPGIGIGVMRIPVHEVQRHVAYNDVHSPHNLNFDPVLSFQKKYEPTHIILNGDFLNLEWASHWNEAVFSDMGWDYIRDNLFKEFEAGRKLLSQIRTASPKAKIYLVPGNHEHWIYYAALYYPKLRIPLPARTTTKGFKSDLAKQGDAALAYILSDKDVLNAKEYDLTVLPHNEHLDIGKITYLHGHQFNTYKNTITKYPSKNIVFGHFHTEYRDTGHNGGDYGRAIQHTAVPCMTDLAPGYLKDKSTRWLQGFWMADVLANGLFDGRVKKIFGGKVMIP